MANEHYLEQNLFVFVSDTENDGTLHMHWKNATGVSSNLIYSINGGVNCWKSAKLTLAFNFDAIIFKFCVKRELLYLVWLYIYYYTLGVCVIYIKCYNVTNLRKFMRLPYIYFLNWIFEILLNIVERYFFHENLPYNTL